MNTYSPDPDSLAAAVCGYLRNNPSVLELSIATMCSLFPGKAKTSNVNPCLATPMAHNLLTRARNAAGELVYRRGRCFDGPVKPVPQPPQPAPAPVRAAPAPAAPASSVQDLATLEAAHKTLEAEIDNQLARDAAAKASRPAVTANHHPKGPAPGKVPNRLPPIDVSKLQLRTNVPLPSPAAAQKGRTRYDDAFDLLTAEGYSVAYPRAYMGSLQQASRTYGKRHKVHLLVRIDPADTTQCAVWRVSALDAQKSAAHALNNKTRSAA